MKPVRAPEIPRRGARRAGRKRGKAAARVDTDNETAKFKFILIVGIVFVVSTFYAYMELKYAMAGKATDAIVESLGEARGRRGRRVPMVYYRYRDDAGNLRKGSSRIDRGFNADTGDRIKVEYLDDASRLAGERNTAALVVFFASLIALGAGGFLFWRHVREATRPSKPYTVPKRF